ncbi:sodium/proton antiporter NhaB [Amphritea sp. HPY]|uniref:sodium/proton antiporter NhaB n=1 Tax=Amphritea sp. HPY TaxID=3421652 RepID=UPI003D7E6240
MTVTRANALYRNFLGNSPGWYKKIILLFLIINPLILFSLGPVVTGWCLIFEFIFTLALALKCYPLQPGGLLTIEAIIIGLADSQTVYQEVAANLDVILLLMFMVAGIFFMKEMLLWVFTKILLNVRSKVMLSLLFSGLSAFLSAFLDALTVTAVLISVGVGFYSVYHRVASGKEFHSDDHNYSSDSELRESHRAALFQFRSFLRSLLMHGAVGTALGGVCTLVGEPQNLLIAQKAGWDFVQFFVFMAPVTMPVLCAGLLTCVALEKLQWFDYGSTLPNSVRIILQDYDQQQDQGRANTQRVRLYCQILVAIFLMFALAFHLAAVGLIGLTVIILLTAFNGITEEHQIGKAFEEALPFTALLVVFFGIVSVIHEQHLFQPMISYVLSMEKDVQPGVFFIANGFLSAISDNVFIANVYINEVVAALNQGVIDREQFEKLAVAINTGTNIPSVATPNGQAAFLFLLTSALAPLIRLSYGKMVWMALPYTLVMSVTGYLSVVFLI